MTPPAREEASMTDTDALKRQAQETISHDRQGLIDLSRRINQNPELGFEEVRSSSWVADALEAGGFSVERGVVDLPTAFVASAGDGELVLGICAEYDALPGIGHACGHNIIAASAVGAGLALAPLAGDLGATVKVFGTPYEEGGGGKVLMLDRGAFDGVHAAMMVHPVPATEETVRTTGIIASTLLEVEYTGRAAHAAAYPWLGLNAADALTVAQVGIGLLRQHFEPGDRVHGVVTLGGGAPNVIPERTTAKFIVRSKTLDRLDRLEARVRDCFEAGALATGCTLNLSKPHPTYSHFEDDEDLVDLYTTNTTALGRPPGDLPDELKDAAGSTDMSNISLAIPSIHPMVGVESGEAVNHQAEFAAACATPSADEAVIHGATAMAWTCIDVATDERVRARLLRGERAVAGR
jgi:amidohydrolase